MGLKKIAPIFFGIFLLLLILTVIKYQNEKITGHSTQESILTYIQLEPEYAKSQEGNKIILGVTMIRLNSKERKDVTVSVFIKESDGSRIKIYSETIALETRVSIIINPHIPKEINKPMQQKSITLEVEIEDSQTKKVLSTAEQRIIITDDFYINISQKSIFYVMAIIIIIIIIMWVIIIILMRRKNFKSPKKYLKN